MVQYVRIAADLSPLQNLSFDVSSLRDNEGSEEVLGGDLLPRRLSAVYGGAEIDLLPLCRLADSEAGAGAGSASHSTVLSAGVYVYFRVDISESAEKRPNIRATCLLMACGMHSRRLYGDVFVGRYGRDGVSNLLGNLDITADEIQEGCVSPDMRGDILSQLGGKMRGSSPQELSPWLANAAMHNYLDSIAISKLASVMMGNSLKGAAYMEGEKHGESSKNNIVAESDETSDVKGYKDSKALRNMTLCIHCRGPSETLCHSCKGVYFCDHPRKCRTYGWSHDCLCSTWRIYCERRGTLNIFPFDWHLPLQTRECQTSDLIYKAFLREKLKVLGVEGGSWWETEVDGWAAGLSGSARTVDASKRRTYLQGFLLDPSLIPAEEHITDVDCLKLGIERDAMNLPKLISWEQYYALRNIPLRSPVALLCTFPLSFFHAIRCHGQVPVTVARMLRRRLRIHAVGVEKEMNFLDLFAELGYLLPKELEVELTFIVREDMLPPKAADRDGGFDIKLELTSNLTLLVKSGTYGGDLDPHFDVGSGSPDLIVGLNAGLFAYSSWKSVISFLHSNKNVVGVFTDYNEWSGTNCASLGGGKSRQSLSINPFRQPVALPVYCMNIPQMSNSFMYVFNEQHLDDYT